jgi:hypothetical protein
MEAEKRFDELKQVMMNCFGDYIKSLNDLHASKKNNQGSSHPLENDLDTKWEQWQQAVTDCNHFVIMGVKK